MRRLAAVAFAFLCACGGNGESDSTSPRPSPTTDPQCETTFGPLVTELGELDSRLDIGFSYDEYGNEIGDLKVTYDAIELGGTSPECATKVGQIAEDALNLYIDAFNIWDRCIGRLSCNTDKIEPDLQAKWEVAADKIAEADSSLDDLTP